MRGARSLVVAVLAAMTVSVVHYVDNVVNYADFPRAVPGSSLPTPSDGLIAAAWFVFTALAIVGLVQVRRRRLVPAVVCLALYSGSGLVGIGHYAVPGAWDMPWWRQAHVVADIVLGILVLALAVRMFVLGRRARLTSA